MTLIMLLIWLYKYVCKAEKFSLAAMASVMRKDVKIPDNAPTEFLLQQHSDFIKKYGDEKEEYDYVMSEFLRINGVYWSLTAMDLMKHRDRLDKAEIMPYVHSCYNASIGGFAPAPRHDPVGD